jgi:mono/diheme cytochrome c family protein
MTKTIQVQLALAAVVLLAGAMSLAQTSGQAIYKANCQSCHGAEGTPNPSMAKMMGIKAVTDPAMKKLTVEQMIASVKNGKGKMKPFAGKLTEPQIKDAVTYFRRLK